MVKLTVKAKRDHFTPPLNDLNLIVLDNFNTEFEIPVVTIKDDGAEEVFQTLTFTPEAVTPPEPPVEGNVLLDSNKDCHWDNGKKRTVDDKEGNTAANGKGYYMAASGDPQVEVQGDGSALLQCGSGHGRLYGAACNYNSILELEFSILSKDTDNLSLKLRSRHQAGDWPSSEGGGSECEKRFGGIGFSISTVDVDSKVETCHNEHSNSKSADLKPSLETNKWYKAKFQCSDSEDGKQIIATGWIDRNDGNGFKQVLQNVIKDPKPHWIDRKTFEKRSEFWIRQNNESDATIALRNVRLTGLP